MLPCPALHISYIYRKRPRDMLTQRVVTATLSSGRECGRLVAIFFC